MIMPILTGVVNMMYDIKDSIAAREVQDIKSNVVELALAVTDDLPVELVNQYCKSLEVAYAAMLRATLESVIRNRGNSSLKSIFKSMPILTNADEITFSKDLNTISSAAGKLFSKVKTEKGGVAISAFMESFKNKIENLYIPEAGMESSSLFLGEQRGGVPTFIEAEITVTIPGGRPVQKKIPIGVSVKPKRFTVEEMVSFFIKQNKKILTPDSAEKARGKKWSLKSVFNLTRIKSDKVTNYSPIEQKTLNMILESCKDVNKPYICLLMSSYSRDMLKDAGVDLKNSNALKNVYNKFPIMSIGVYDLNVDQISYSIAREAHLTTTTAASFNTDVSQLQKTLAEGLRVSRMLQ